MSTWERIRVARKSSSDSMGGSEINRLHLHTEEARLIAALSSVRSKLNDLLPISSLPPEILEEIFDICVSWLYSYQKPKHRLAWTQVCRAWRRISLNSSRLWQRIDLCDSRFADEFLVRSKQAPLSIVSASPFKLTTDSLTIHAGRLRSIDLFLFADDMAHLFSSIGPNLSMLTDLSLKVPPVSSTLALALSFPFVRRLVLDCVAIQWESCRNLTHLSLRGLNTEYCPSISGLHDLFERSPNLVYVRLESLMPPDLSTERTRCTISLVHLKDLIISGQPHVVTAILSAIRLGPRARLQLYVPLSDDLHSIFPNGLPYLSNTHQDDVGSIRLSRHGAHFLRHGAPSWSEDSAEVLFSISSSRPLSTRVCSSVDRLLNLSRVTKLELNTAVLLDMSLKVLHNLFADLSKLEALYIAFNDIEDLLDILQTIDPATSQLYLPHLSTLSFSKSADLWWQFNERWMTPIYECLRARSLHAVPIETLEFFRCGGVSSACTKQLESVVRQVTIHEDTRTHFHN